MFLSLGTLHAVYHQAGCLSTSCYRCIRIVGLVASAGKAAESVQNMLFSVLLHNCDSSAVNLTPPSNSLHHNKLLQGGRGIFLLLHKTSLLQIVTSSHSSWLLAVPAASGSRRTAERASLWQQRRVVSENVQNFLLLLNMLHNSMSNIRGGDLLFPNSESRHTHVDTQHNAHTLAEDSCLCWSCVWSSGLTINCGHFLLS